MLHETREIACYLRNGSLWVGRFTESDEDLDFGDDRFHAAHGLARVAHAGLPCATQAPDARPQTPQGPAVPSSAASTAVPQELKAARERLRLAA